MSMPRREERNNVVFDRAVLEVKRELDFGSWDVGAMFSRPDNWRRWHTSKSFLDIEHKNLICRNARFQKKTTQ